LSSGEVVKDIPASEAINSDGRIPLFSPDGATLALGEMDGRIRLLDLKSGRSKEISTPTEGNTVAALAFSPDGTKLASGHAYSDGAIYLYNALTGDPMGSLEGHRGWVSKLLFAPDGQRLYSASADQTIRVWDMAQKKEIDLLRGHIGSLRGLALFPDGRTLASCADDGSVRVWDVKSKSRPPAHVVLPVKVGPYGAPFTGDSRWLITASTNAPVIVWDVATARELERIPALGTNNLSVALSPDGNTLLGLSWSGVADLYRAPSWAEIEANEKERKAP
jgi:WD40 repeat protein